MSPHISPINELSYALRRAVEKYGQTVANEAELPASHIKLTIIKTLFYMSDSDLQHLAQFILDTATGIEASLQHLAEVVQEIEEENNA